MLLPPTVQQGFMERARHWLVGLRRLLAAPGWAVAQAGAAERGLRAIEDHAANHRLDDVYRAATRLRADWQRLKVTDIAPDDDARRVLGEAAQQLFRAVAELAGVDDQTLGLPVYALLTGQPPSAAVLQGFRSQGLELILHPDGDALAAALATRRPEALLVETPLAAALAELLDRLSPTLPGVSQLPIVALATADDPQPRLNAALAGADLYCDALEDPALAGRLRRLLAEYRRDPYRVLLVDDDAATGMLYEAILRRAGFEATLARDADQARQALARQMPDLLLLDLNLPGEGGLSLAASIRELNNTLLPIVFLSGEEGDEARLQALRVGGDDFLGKPVRPRHLIAVTRSRIKRARLLARQLAARVTEERGHLRRGAFLQRLRQALLGPVPLPGALLVFAVDDADALQQRLGVVRSHALERAVGARFQPLLTDDDVYCLLDDFSFALCAVRDSGEALDALAQAIVATISGADFRDAGATVSLTASAGLARRPGQGDDVEGWLQQAMTALATARRLGGHRVEGIVDRREHGLTPEHELRVRALLRTAGSTDWRLDYRPLLPMRSDRLHHYAVDLRLRDAETGATGIAREVWALPAQSLGLLDAIERRTLNSLLALLVDYDAHGQPLELCLPLAPGSLNAVRACLPPELTTLQGGTRLLLELDADAAIDQAALLERFAAHRLSGIALGIHDTSGRFGHWPALAALPVQSLRVPAATLLAGPAAAGPAIATWRHGGRLLIADEVPSAKALSNLWSLGVDLVAGDVVAPASARPDFDFADYAS